MKISYFIKLLSVILLVSISAQIQAQKESGTLPEGFVYVKEVIPKLRTDLRYYSENNFIGKPIDGYNKPKCILTVEAAQALKKVQQDFEKLGFGLLVFDAYRPQRAVNQFVQWAQDTTDNKMKDKYYPNIDKKDLFKEEYIAAKSGHSRGSTVDLTIVSLKTGHILDLGSDFDLFDERSNVNYKNVTKNQRSIRLMLQRRMVKHGFKPHEKEWWHFTLAKEPYPDTYFDFSIE
ncbi:M15 family metallopeptidase [Aureibaculum sp. 2210JD6-5]|uniref:M15 family metallopeptidase n=1 Tax=Aureibaculum sp. 2210JD6-5 TaxID=3103957 RepID=UPI002AAE1616|nr:M15 family metallopeptidase [Aureibaculum sp. 2210JD6-5]MDY7393658.1 M15 family metallopeptidase [Aureibaculum sp. 2210JD6-5]